MPHPTSEQIDQFYETMPTLAADHVKDGPFHLLPTRPEDYQAQQLGNEFIEAHHGTKRQLDSVGAVAVASAFATNLEEICSEMHDDNGRLIDQIQEAQYIDDKTVLLVGDHDSFDNIIYPDIAISRAEAMRNPGFDKPERRTIIMAKQLGWYGLGKDAVVELLLNHANVALTAPGTISGKKTSQEVRDFINAVSVLHITERLDRGKERVTFAYAGQTNRKIVNPITGETVFNVQYTPSDGSLSLLMHPNVVVVPFATHRDEVTKNMTFAIGEPRAIQSAEEGRELGNEIAYLSWRISGVHTLQALDKKQFEMLTAENPEPAQISQILRVAREFIRLNRSRYHYDNQHGYYIVGAKDSLAEKPQR